MRLIPAILLFLMATITFLTWTIPVAVVVNALTLPDKLNYEGLEGTLWSGKVDAVQFNTLQVVDVSWQLKPLSLLMGKLAVDVDFGDPRDAQLYSGRGSIAYGFSGIGAQDVILRVPADTLRQFSPVPMNPLAGRLVIELANWQTQQAICQELDGQGTWLNAGIDLNGPIPLQTISATLDCDNEQLAMRLDGNNLLGAAGNVLVRDGKQYQVDLLLNPAPELPAIVTQGLTMFTKPNAKGEFAIKF